MLRKTVSRKLPEKIMKKTQSGFTLIELMVAVAIVGILAAIAIPGYQESMRKSRRVDAEGALLVFANGMERHFTEGSTYRDAAGDGVDDDGNGKMDYGTNGAGNPDSSVYSAPTGISQNYLLTISFANDITYTLRATPVAGSAQAGNGVLEIDQDGKRRWDKNNNDNFELPDEEKWD